MSISETPCVIVGGYLGSGKTTLINDYLRDPKGLRVTVLVNDFGAINIDAALIENNSGDTIALTNGCACCSIGDDLFAAATRVMQADPKPDLVIVETSGVARPDRIAMLLLGVGGLAQPRILTLIDASRARTLASDKFLARLFRSQIRAASALSVNRKDRASDAEFVSELVRDHAKKVPQVDGLVDLMNGAESIEPADLDPWEMTDATHAVEFQTRTLELPDLLMEHEIRKWFSALPERIERAKGCVRVISEDNRTKILRLNRTGTQITFAEVASGANINKVVVIGPEPLPRCNVPGVSVDA